MLELFISAMSESPGLYVHVPFCKSKCAYCGFYSIAEPRLIDRWLSALAREASLYVDHFTPFDTLYLGGGTPSLLSTHQIERLFYSLRECFSFASDTEITLEANPDDISDGLLTCWRDLGVNRLSLGIQSFEEEELRFLGRRHTAAEARTAIETARHAGFNNLSLDFIYGLPHQTERRWRRSLEAALEYRPEHLSCYQLSIEPGSRFDRLVADGRLHPASKETQSALFLFTSEFLEQHGYEHYEVSNFALEDHCAHDDHDRLCPDQHRCHEGFGFREDHQEASDDRHKLDGDRQGYRSRHNSKYWCHVPYLGLGPAAHSLCYRETSPPGGTAWDSSQSPSPGGPLDEPLDHPSMFHKEGRVDHDSERAGQDAGGVGYATRFPHPGQPLEERFVFHDAAKVDQNTGIAGHERQSTYHDPGSDRDSPMKAERWWNPASLPEWLCALEARRSPVEARERLTPEQLRLEAIMLGLRTREGIPVALLNRPPDSNAPEPFEPTHSPESFESTQTWKRSGSTETWKPFNSAQTRDSLNSTRTPEYFDGTVTSKPFNSAQTPHSFERLRELENDGLIRLRLGRILPTRRGLLLADRLALLLS